MIIEYVYIPQDIRNYAKYLKPIQNEKEKLNDNYRNFRFLALISHRHALRKYTIRYEFIFKIHKMSDNLYTFFIIFEYLNKYFNQPNRNESKFSNAP